MTDKFKKDEITLSLKGEKAIFAINQIALSKHGIFKDTFETILKDPKQTILHIYAINYFVSLRQWFSQSYVYSLLKERLQDQEQDNCMDFQLIKALMEIDPEQTIADFSQYSLERQKTIIDLYLQLELYHDYCLRRQVNTELTKLPIEKTNQYLLEINNIISEQHEK